MSDLAPFALLHGWGMHRQALASLATACGEGRRVLFLDLPGHGGCTETSLDPDDWPGLVAKQLEKISGPVDLLGWSLGGMLALLAAAARPHLVRRLVLVSTTPRFVAGEGWESGLPDGQVRALARQLRRDFATTLKAFAGLMKPGEPPAGEGWGEWWAVHGRPEMFPDQQSALSGLELLCRLDLRELATKATAPTLVIHGGSDRVVPPAAGRWLAANLPGAEFVLLPGAGHAPFFPSPTELAGHVREFLR